MNALELFSWDGNNAQNDALYLIELFSLADH